MSPLSCGPARASRASPRQLAGEAAESRALDYLLVRGLRPLARNFRTRAGEVDLVMADGREVVFVEVRSRADPRFGGAAGSVDAGKQRRVRLAAQAWLLSRYGGARWPAVRFDVVAFEGPRLVWIAGAF